MGASESLGNYQELVEGQFSSSAVIANDRDNWKTLPPDAVHNILYHLDVEDLGVHCYWRPLKIHREVYADQQV